MMTRPIMILTAQIYVYNSFLHSIIWHVWRPLLNHLSSIFSLLFFILFVHVVSWIVPFHCVLYRLTPKQESALPFFVPVSIPASPLYILCAGIGITPSARITLVYIISYVCVVFVFVMQDAGCVGIGPGGRKSKRWAGLTT